jgi:hypothetical protein
MIYWLNINLGFAQLILNGIIFVDLEIKAFATIDHNILLPKLKWYVVHDDKMRYLGLGHIYLKVNKNVM